MPELNREDIIKALECCSQKPYADCNNCPYKDIGLECFVSEVPKNALALIKQLTEENERLENQLDSLGSQYRAGAEFLCDQAKQDVAREIFEDFSKHKVCTNEEDFRVLADLNKKYIGE